MECYQQQKEMNNLAIPQNGWSLSNFSKWDKIDQNVLNDPSVWHSGKGKATGLGSRAGAAWDCWEGIFIVVSKRKDSEGCSVWCCNSEYITLNL